MKNKKVLITDDTTDVRITIREAFEAEQAICFEANNGTEAQAILKTERIDLVILDFALPQGNGIEILKIIQSELDYNPAIIIYSGYCDVIPEDEFVLNTVLFFVEKPYPPDKLVELGKKAIKQQS